MKEISLSVGDIIQIDPLAHRLFGGCLMVVTEPKSWGAQGYIDIPGEGQAYYNCRFDQMELVGKAEWLACNKEEIYEKSG